MKRLFILGSVLALAASAVAQNQYPEEDRILAGFSKLRDESQLYLYVEGSETTNSVTNRFKTHLYWYTVYDGVQPTTKFQLLQIQDGNLVQRIVADGNTVWNYDHVGRQYSALRYGGYRPERPQNYRRDLLAFVTANAKGQGSYAVRMLREIYGESSSVYRSWMPGVRPTELPDGSTQDPVWNERTYMGSPSIDVLLYNGSPRRTISFQLEDDPPSDVYRLSNIFFTERVALGTRDRLTEWKLTPYKGIVFEEKNFQPYSYDETRGWKPIADSTSKG